MNEFNADPLLDLNLLDRYLADEAAPAERAQVEAWLAANPLHAQRLHALQTLGDSLDITRTEALNVDRAWTQVARERESFLRGRIRSVTIERNSSKSAGNQILWRGVFKKQTLRRRVWYAFAGIASVMAIAVALYIGKPRFGGHQQVPVSTYVTGNGQRANITLPDGSTVALNADSRLDVPADYLAGNHTLRLNGEAIITVNHHAGRALAVVAGGTTACVLGTTFLVRHYATDRVTTVAVREGRVMVRSGGGRPVVLTAAQQIAIGGRGSAGVQIADPTQFTFATGVLTLRSVPFPAAMVELDRWYDADIRFVGNTLKGQRVTGEYGAGSLGDLASILELTFNVRVVRNGRVLTLFPK